MLVVLATNYCSAADQEPLVTQLFDENGFAIPESGDLLRFPRDHGSHPNFKNEWWYVTGHCQTLDGANEYGFQLTFFRAVLDEEYKAESSAQFYMAHAALLDKRSRSFSHEERLSPEGWNANAAVGKLDVFVENWYLKMVDEKTETMKARFSVNANPVFNLQLIPLKSKNLFGNNGVSKKGSEASARSYYVNHSRLKVTGDIQIEGKNLEVKGLAWIDHEFSSNQLSENQIGWNWTSLILNDGTELMAYIMRRDDGEKDPNSALTIIDKSGEQSKIPNDRFDWTPTRFWQSPTTQATYPVAYKVEWTDSNGKQKTVHVKAIADNQELQGQRSSIVYWEGACEAYNERGEKIGEGYTELTGYDSSLRGRF